MSQTNRGRCHISGQHMGAGDALAMSPRRLPSFSQPWLAMAFGQSPARAVFWPDFASIWRFRQLSETLCGTAQLPSWTDVECCPTKWIRGWIGPPSSTKPSGNWKGSCPCSGRYAQDWTSRPVCFRALCTCTTISKWPGDDGFQAECAAWPPLPAPAAASSPPAGVGSPTCCCRREPIAAGDLAPAPSSCCSS